MANIHYIGDYPRNPLEIKELAEFDETISLYSRTEQKSRRLIYLGDAVQKMRTGKSILKGFGWIMVPLAKIPIFWPFFIFVWFARKKAATMIEAQLCNAMKYWGINEWEIDEYVSDDLFDSDDIISIQ
jgi:hypothetical protein